MRYQHPSLVAPGRAEGYRSSAGVRGTFAPGSSFDVLPQSTSQGTYYRSGGRCQTLDAQPTYLDEKYLSDVRLLTHGFMVCVISCALGSISVLSTLTRLHGTQKDCFPLNWTLCRLSLWLVVA